MPDTRKFEIVAEVDVDVLRAMLRAAWDNGGTNAEGAIPHEVAVPPGLAVGPYQVDHGQVRIPKAGLDLDMAPADNGVAVTLATNSQVALDPATLPVPSLGLFDTQADITITAPFGLIPPSQTNVGVIFEGLPRNKVSVTLTSGEPIGPITTQLIEEYLDTLYQNGTIPPEQTLLAQSWGGMTFDVYIEFFNDAAVPGRDITAEFTDATETEVAVTMPVHVKLANITGVLPVLSPMGVLADLVVTAPYQKTANQVRAVLTSATFDVQNVVPADGVEGTNYTANKAGAALMGIDLEQLFVQQIKARGTLVVQAMGDITVAVPSQAQIEKLIGDEVHKELLARKYFGTWTPETPEGSDVEVESVVPKALAEGLAIGINPQAGADANLLSFFVPAGQDFGIALDADFVEQTIQEVVDSPEPEGLGGIPKTWNNIEGHKVKLKSLHWNLESGKIHFWGDVTVYDVFCGADSDVSFWADVGLRWTDPDASGAQSLEPYIIDKDASLPWWAWLIAVIGFIVGGVIIGVIITVINLVVDSVIDKVAGKMMKQEVGDAIQALGAWPQQLQGIGTVASRFQRDVGIDSKGLLFSGSMLVTSTYALTYVSSDTAGGPYAGKAGAPIATHVPPHPKAQHRWWFEKAVAVDGYDASHTYADNSRYVLRMRTNVTEDGGASTHHSVFVDAENVPPVVEAGVDQAVDEGDVVSFVGRFTDQEWPDVHEATWDFGDDSLPAPGVLTETNDPPRAEGTVTGEHAFCDNGTYTVTLHVRDDDGGIGSDTMQVKVLNVAPTVDAGELVYAYPCVPLTLVADFYDPGWCDTHTAFWVFGDCTAELPATVVEVNEPPAGYGIAAATHTYDVCGTFLAECTVIDDDGGVGTDTVVVQVTDVANGNFEAGFRVLTEGEVANHWEPYLFQYRDGTQPGAGGGALYRAEEHVVHDGQRSQRIGGGGSFRAGIRQQVGANLDWDYQVSVWYHLAESLGGVCRLGIDPGGGVDHDSPDIVWVSGTEHHDWRQLAVRVTATSDTITIFLETVADARGDQGFFDGVVLAPIPCPLPDPEPPELPEPEPERRCVNWLAERRAHQVGREFEKNGFFFRSYAPEPMQVVVFGAPEGRGKLRIPSKGMEVVLPFAADRVTAEVVSYTAQKIKLVARDEQGGLISTAVSSGEKGNVEVLEVTGGEIRRIELTGGGGEGLLIELCAFAGAGPSPNKQFKPAVTGRQRVLSAVATRRSPCGRAGTVSAVTDTKGRHGVR